MNHLPIQGSDQARCYELIGRKQIEMDALRNSIFALYCELERKRWQDWWAALVGAAMLGLVVEMVIRNLAGVL